MRFDKLRNPNTRLGLLAYGGVAALSSLAIAACGGQGSSAEAPVKPAKPDPRVEVEQFGAPTFGDYRHAAEPGPFLPKGTKVLVRCVVQGPKAAAPSAEGVWYDIIGPKQFAGEYAAANTFENGDTSGPLSSQPAVDPRLDRCGAPGQ